MEMDSLLTGIANIFPLLLRLSSARSISVRQLDHARAVRLR